MWCVSVLAPPPSGYQELNDPRPSVDIRFVDDATGASTPNFEFTSFASSLIVFQLSNKWSIQWNIAMRTILHFHSLFFGLVVVSAVAEEGPAHKES
jgi:hypothetical protein